MKICSSCKKTKPLTDFNWKDKRKDNRQTFCRDCQHINAKKHYENNKQYYIDKRKRRNDTLINIIRKLKDKPCVDCGIKYPYYVMDFDHREGNVKIADITRLSNRGFSIEKILEEIKKCDLVCSNCHRERTHKRLLNKQNRVVG